MLNTAPKKRHRRISTLQMLIDRDAFGPRTSKEAMIMIAAARHYHNIMSSTDERPPVARTPNSYVDNSLDPTRFDATIVRSIDHTKAISELRAGLPRFFLDVLDLIIVHDLTTEETAERLFLKADSKTQNATLERLRGALIHLAATKFGMFSK
ncbi:hypothetical protein E4K64_14750 [Bradyrhizobium frederickii]|uniref:Uncharacterized protein n=1 Tax=Bradyrhizobium frederickii TaxID=2560054 RepID=A0A4Y9P8M9_9BRAD|nr:hypothetical protein [Bradyrhizobium frederickii]TFV75842.1 hypothetical protein E4K64_14750 [Bradyrhizobium frederickii]